ncbi:hypothetical protein FY528_00730 [Hymenobacter lutimineralis]|uniref:Transglutaminase domain-containing protein n=1 Tax=Hymenobacter lutimineralis TaxID=2606448 RepID=A0A5D6VG98_9BACT|nr:hypothetical protein [Hymenobacter lutimineralis]TYZ14287.1 hypothetical protein FY528_00730 [Hymenobacter lutimineralis]
MAYYDIDQTVTAEDKQYIQLYLQGIPSGPASAQTYDQQLALIKAAQNVVLTHSITGVAIALGQPREPKDVYTSHLGLCYDRIRVLEKIFMKLGYQTRHVTLFADVPALSKLQELTTAGVPSHAITEVLTKKGWLAVDSNHRWVAIDAQNQPYSMENLQAKLREGKASVWLTQPEHDYQQFYSKPCTFIYGLYSRHGQFYPPYTPGIPDYNLRELLYNF